MRNERRIFLLPLSHSHADFSPHDKWTLGQGQACDKKQT